MNNEKSLTKHHTETKSQNNAKETLTNESVELTESTSLTNADVTKSQVAAYLKDQRLPLVQRQAIAAQIGEVQGNGHLQGVVTFLKRDKQISDTVGKSRAAHEQRADQMAKEGKETAAPILLDSMIQRQPHSQPQEFIPHTSASSDMVFLLVFQPYTHTWKIDNWRDAPANTYFNWGWGIDGDGVLKVISDSDQHAGATQQIRLQAQKSGNTHIQGTPVHQVPGGPQIVGDTQFVGVTVQEPTLEYLSTMPRRADGSGVQIDHLSVGDKLIVRVKVGNVDGKYIEDPKGVYLTGQGQELVSSGTAMLRPVQQFPDGKSYDLELIVLKEGSLNLQLELGIGRMAQGTGPTINNITAEIEYDRQKFINLCNQCDTIIDLAYTQANSIMEVLSAAYGNAWEAHERVLEAQDASNKLVGELVLNAALAFIPGGVGGVVGKIMKNAEMGEFLADGVKDMAKAGVKSLQSAALPGGNGSSLQPMGTNPRTWRAQYVVHGNNEKKKVLVLLNDWKTKANNSDPNFYLNFDPVTVMEQSLVQGGQPLKVIQVPDQAESERLFELGFWRDWLENYGYTVVKRYHRGGGVTHHASENQGKKIRDRINELGEDGDQWLEQYGGVALRKAQAEAKRRNLRGI